MKTFQKDLTMLKKNPPALSIRPQMIVVVLLAASVATGCETGEGAPTSATSSAPPTTTSSAATPGSPAAVAPVGSPPAAVGVPDAAAIQRAMTRTIEVSDPSTHFTADGKPVTTSDRHGGTLTAVVGQRTPTADGKGQLVFFWHGMNFVGWDAVTETDSIRGVTAGPGYFKVAYTHYAERDPMCCASLPPVTVTYTWQDSGRLAQSGQIPHYGDPVRVKLTS